jgi:hypothetical protein
VVPCGVAGAVDSVLVPMFDVPVIGGVVGLLPFVSSTAVMAAPTTAANSTAKNTAAPPPLLPDFAGIGTGAAIRSGASRLVGSTGDPSGPV